MVGYIDYHIGAYQENSEKKGRGHYKCHSSFFEETVLF